MFQALSQRLKSLQHNFDRSVKSDLSTSRGRFSAWVHFHLMDHAFLRFWWTNLDEIAPGVWRSNQPGPARIKRYAKMGIRTVITLRGRKERSYTLLAREACEAHGIAFETARLLSRALVRPDEILHLLDLFKTVERPFLMHCKSGADRAGLASALYVLAEGSGDIEEAKAQLSLRYLHLKNDSTGIIDMMLQVFEEDHRESGIGIRDWIETKYDPDAITARFRDGGLRKSRDG